MLDEVLKKIRKEKYVVEQDRYDEFVFDDVKDYEGFKPVYKLDYPAIDELAFDTFKLFFKRSPKFLDDEKIDPRYVINKRILEKAVNTEIYDKLRTMTVGDEVNSAIATAHFITTVVKELIEKDPRLCKKLEDLSDLTKQLTNLALEYAKRPSRDIERKIENVRRKIEQKLSTIDIPQIVVSRAVREAFEKTSEMNEAVSSVSAAWGTEPGAITHVPAEERLKLASELAKNQKLFELAKMLGKVRNVMLSVKKSKVRRPISELYDISLGRDLSRLVPYELAKLSDPDLELDFFKRFAEGQLMVYNLREKNRLGEGDFVACIDVSGSMCGEKEIWAKAVALALMEHAVKRKRRFSVVMFDTEIKYSKTFEGRPTLEDVIEIARIATSGGTNFEAPLDEARKIIESGTPNADILFISDGECKVDDRWLEEFEEFKKRTNTKVVSVFVGGWGYEELKRFSDHVERVENFVEDSAKIFRHYV